VREIERGKREGIYRIKIKRERQKNGRNQDKKIGIALIQKDRVRVKANKWKEETNKS